MKNKSCKNFLLFCSFILALAMVETSAYARIVSPPGVSLRCLNIFSKLFIDRDGQTVNRYLFSGLSLLDDARVPQPFKKAFLEFSDISRRFHNNVENEKVESVLDEAMKFYFRARMKVALLGDRIWTKKLMRGKDFFKDSPDNTFDISGFVYPATDNHFNIHVICPREERGSLSSAIVRMHLFEHTIQILEERKGAYRDAIMKNPQELVMEWRDVGAIRAEWEFLGLIPEKILKIETQRLTKIGSEKALAFARLIENSSEPFERFLALHPDIMRNDSLTYQFPR